MVIRPPATGELTTPLSPPERPPQNMKRF